MNHFSRLRALGYVGVPELPAFIFNLTEKKLFDAAKKRGKVRGLQALRGFEQFQELGTDPDAALILDYGLIWPLLWNFTTAWSGTGKAYLEQTLNAFEGNKPGLSYYRRKLNEKAQIASSFSLVENQPWAIRFFIFNPEKETDITKAQPKNRHRVRFGGGTALWQLTICDGSFELARLSEHWNQEQQSALDVLEDKEEPTLEDAEAIAAIRGPVRREAGGIYSPDAIFESVDSLSLGSPKETQLGKFYEFTILPEPRGRLNVILTGSKAEFVEVPQVLAAAKSGTVTGAGPLQIWTSGAPYLAQIGRPAFRATGELITGPFRKTGNTLSDFEINNSGDSAHVSVEDGDPYNATLVGTDIYTSARALDSVWFEFATKLSTTDNRFTPFLYSLQTYYPAQPRPFSNDVGWDSNNHLDDGHPPIEEIEWSCDGANRASTATVTIIDAQGRALAGLTGPNTPALENRLGHLDYGPLLSGLTPLLRRALIVDSQLSAMASADSSLSRAIATTPETQLVVTLADLWALLDEIPAAAIKGDGKYLGAVVRSVLEDAGFTTAEMTGVSSTFGRILPRAALGESDCIIPGNGESCGDYLRRLLDRWGMGATLVHNENGVWRLSMPSTALRSVTLYESGFTEPGDPNSGTVEIEKTVNLEFSSDTTRHNSETYPGRLAILGPLDLARDFKDFFNDFVVIGAINPATGQRFSARYTNDPSVKNLNSINHIGRLKTLEVRDDGIRNEDDLKYVIRSLIERHGKPGRFCTFETYFHPFLYPDDRILIDGATWILKALNGGSLARDAMSVTAQQLTA